MHRAAHGMKSISKPKPTRHQHREATWRGERGDPIHRPPIHATAPLHSWYKAPGRPKATAGTPRPSASATLAASAIEEARRAGLLDGEKTEHISFCAPPALVEAAKRAAC